MEPVRADTVRRTMLLWLPLLVLANVGHAQNADDPRLANRKCSPIDVPKKVPAVNQVLDSSATLDALASLAVPESVNEVNFSLSVVDGVARIRALEEGPSALVESLLALMFPHLRPEFRPDAPSIRIRLLWDKTIPVLSVVRSHLCVPVPQGRAARGVVRVTTTTPPPQRLRDPRIRLRIDTEGRVVRAEVTVSSGVPELDREIVRALEEGRFFPALLDGQPVEVWYLDGRADLVR